MTYIIRVTVGASLSSDVTVDIPVRIIDFLSIDPPPEFAAPYIPQPPPTPQLREAIHSSPDLMSLGRDGHPATSTRRKRNMSTSALSRRGSQSDGEALARSDSRPRFPARRVSFAAPKKETDDEEDAASIPSEVREWYARGSTASDIVVQDESADESDHQPTPIRALKIVKPQPRSSSPDMLAPSPSAVESDNIDFSEKAGAGYNSDDEVKFVVGSAQLEGGEKFGGIVAVADAYETSSSPTEESDGDFAPVRETQIREDSSTPQMRRKTEEPVHLDLTPTRITDKASQFEKVTMVIKPPVAPRREMNDNSNVPRSHSRHSSTPLVNFPVRPQEHNHSQFASTPPTQTGRRVSHGRSESDQIPTPSSASWISPPLPLQPRTHTPSLRGGSRPLPTPPPSSQSSTPRGASTINLPNPHAPRLSTSKPSGTRRSQPLSTATLTTATSPLSSVKTRIAMLEQQTPSPPRRYPARTTGHEEVLPNGFTRGRAVIRRVSQEGLTADMTPPGLSRPNTFHSEMTEY